jgi:hypothetical protein
MPIYSNYLFFFFRFQIPVIFDLLLTDVIFLRLGITAPYALYIFFQFLLPEPTGRMHVRLHV